MRMRIAAIAVPVAAAAALLGSAPGGAAQAGAARSSPPVYIQFQLTETYQHAQPKTNSTWGSTASVDEVQPATVAELSQNTVLGGYRVLSDRFTAQLASGQQKCSWTGSLTQGEAPEMTITRVGGHSYGMVGWPDRTGLAFKQALARGSASGCPAQAQFSPLQGPTVSSTPSSRLSAGERFYGAIFPIPPRHGTQSTISVSMSTSGAVAGQTDQTTARGVIRISYGRCPTGVHTCTATN